VKRPLIGIPAQTLQAIDGIPEGLPHSWAMNARYYTAIANSGGAPVMIPLLTKEPEALREIYDRLDGILLAGGVDMDPCTFGEDPHPELGRTDPARDTVEVQLAQWSVADGKPILGLCRGHQVLNVALGGTLWQDIGTQVTGALKHDYFPTAGYAREYLAHDVVLAPGSRILAAFDRPTIRVNSMHHQAVKTLAANLVATGRSPDDLIEAFEGQADSEQFLVGVQWHPEVFERTDAPTKRLFAAFVEAARTGRG